MEWISVEERLPQKHGRYLVFTNRGGIEILRYEGQKGVVTHWMPLPGLPQNQALQIEQAPSKWCC